MSFGELFTLWLSLYARVHCKSWRNYERMYASYLSDFGKKPAADITKLDVIQIQAQLAEAVSKTTANRVVELISMVYRRCSQDFDMSLKNPAAGIKKFKLQPRERFLQKDEVARFFDAVDTLRYAVTRDFLIMCLFTGARRANVAAMRWADIDIDQRVWRIPETKNGTSQYVPLVDEAMAILARRKTADNKSPFVFPSDRSPTGHLTKPELAWSQVIKRANLENVRIHDLRRSLASYMAISGVNLSTIQSALNHKSVQSTMIYARLNTDAVRRAIETATDAMFG